MISMIFFDIFLNFIILTFLGTVNIFKLIFLKIKSILSCNLVI